jgi:hypothetical protein
MIFLNLHNYFNFIFFYVAWAWGNAFETIVFDDYLDNLQFIDNYWNIFVSRTCETLRLHWRKTKPADEERTIIL